LTFRRKQNSYSSLKNHKTEISRILSFSLKALIFNLGLHKVGENQSQKIEAEFEIMLKMDLQKAKYGATKLIFN
jgi:NAD-dependent DNA ligase